MAIPFDFGALEKRLADVRSWAGDVTEGNRCAMVLGQALRLTPGSSHESMHGKSFVSENVRHMPFTKKFFVKAWDLTETVLNTWGPAGIRISGRSSAKALEGKRGFIYLEDCWKTPTEKMNGLIFGVDVQSGDHVDLWNGSNLAIYPKRNDSLALLRQSRNVWFWECKL